MRSYPQQYPTHKEKIAGVVVFHSPSQRVLLLEKSNGEFDLPKGHVEQGETLLEGALRECWEETGLHYQHNLNVFPYHHVSIPSHKWLIFYLGYTTESDIKLTEHIDYYWETPQNAIALLGPDNQLGYIVTAMSILSQTI